jgi:hypothetical protein
MTILSILATRRRDEGVPAPIIFKMLVLAVLLLSVAAVVWGGLAGQPTWAEMKELTTGDQPLLSIDAARAVLAEEMVVGSTGVTLLAVGALSMIWGIVEVVSRQEPSVSGFVDTAYAVIASLGVYEVVLFALTPMNVFWGVEKDIDVWSVVLTGAVLAITVTVSRWNRRPREKHGRTRRMLFAGKFDGLALKLAAVTGVAGTGAYVFTPNHSEIENTGGNQSDLVLWDNLSLGLAVVASVAFILFVIVSSGQLVVRSDQESTSGDETIDEVRAVSTVSSASESAPE